MKDVKRIELVIDAAHTPELIKVIRASGATGFTVVRDVHGSGDRGDRMGDELGNVFRNCYIIVAAGETIAEKLIYDARPLLERYGGMCLVSDAGWIKH
ncbi:MAG: transcriptional regulator [Planctomycetota bacterium]